MRRTGTVESDVKQHQVFLQRERERECVCARKTTHARIFRGKHFFLYAAGLLPLLARVRPCYLELTRVFRFSRWLSLQNLRWWPHVSRLRSCFSRSIHHILSKGLRGLWQNMAKLFWWLQDPETFLKVFLPRRYGILFSDEDLRSINDKTVSLNLKYLGTNPTTNSYTLELEYLFL